jgi:threonine dehydrogenase-like Zn-dependent dehydrogenase
MPVARAFADELALSFAIGDGMRDHDSISALVAARIVDPTVLIDNRVSIADAASGYAAMAARRTLKTVIDVI